MNSPQFWAKNPQNKKMCLTRSLHVAHHRPGLHILWWVFGKPQIEEFETRTWCSSGFRNKIWTYQMIEQLKYVLFYVLVIYNLDIAKPERIIADILIYGICEDLNPAIVRSGSAWLYGWIIWLNLSFRWWKNGCVNDDLKSKWPDWWLKLIEVQKM